MTISLLLNQILTLRKHPKWSWNISLSGYIMYKWVEFCRSYIYEIGVKQARLWQTDLPLLSDLAPGKRTWQRSTLFDTYTSERAVDTDADPHGESCSYTDPFDNMADRSWDTPFWVSQWFELLEWFHNFWIEFILPYKQIWCTFCSSIIGKSCYKIAWVHKEISLGSWLTEVKDLCDRHNV